ncbi:helix-turn-helix domain-containing protein [Nocardioides sp.]|uniref:PucR family transcriptional regulator n=1 Tax=Nocardioides sp. TaxID=35761 RepID=UPI002609951A|nr:helix-turn-helix domain-containing protein [Nocardioides sp.]
MTTSSSRPERSGSGPVLTLQTVRRLRGTVTDFAERTADRVQQHVSPYAGPKEGRRRHLIVMAARASANVFLESLGSRPPSATGLHDLLRRMGYGEASEGHSLDPLDAAVRLGHLEALDLMQAAVDRGEVPLHALPAILSRLAVFVDRLVTEAHTGAELYLEFEHNDPPSTRRALLHALISRDQDRATILADRIGWEVPAAVVVLAATGPADVDWPADTELAPALVDTSCLPGLFVVVPEEADALQTRLRRLHPGITVARSWPVGLTEVGHARRWVLRALHLSTTGAIPRQPVIDCSRYFTQLWLHAEPSLRSQLVQTRLGPLLGESANSREILSSTLLVWLRTRESAPAIAEMMGVHPQTIRYRWRKINELFGEDLLDPAIIVQTLLALEATLPLWTAGDKSDLKRYKAERRRAAH